MQVPLLYDAHPLTAGVTINGGGLMDGLSDDTGRLNEAGLSHFKLLGLASVHQTAAITWVTIAVCSVIVR
jgi:hypothetical protein